jgi:hypothetical protein
MTRPARDVTEEMFLFGQTAHMTSYATRIWPREGYTYEAAVICNDGLFSIGSRRNARRGAGCRDRILPRARLIETAELKGCGAPLPNERRIGTAKYFPEAARHRMCAPNGLAGCGDG